MSVGCCQLVVSCFEIVEEGEIFLFLLQLDILKLFLFIRVVHFELRFFLILILFQIHLVDTEDAILLHLNNVSAENMLEGGRDVGDEWWFSFAIRP